jgi:hypothetical protein
METKKRAYLSRYLREKDLEQSRHWWLNEPELSSSIEYSTEKSTGPVDSGSGMLGGPVTNDDFEGCSRTRMEDEIWEVERRSITVSGVPEMDDTPVDSAVACEVIASGEELLS